MIQGVFIEAPELESTVGGFQSTFFVRAATASGAASRVPELLRDRMIVRGVRAKDVGLFRTYYCIYDIWEITEERWSSLGGRDTGFTYFRIGSCERWHFALRRLWIARFRPQFSLDLRLEP